MKFLRRHWYEVSAVIGTLCIVAGAIFWNELGVLRGLALLNFAVLMFHVFEEFGFPGGFPKFANTVLFNSPRADRYPLNQNSVMIGNWSFAVLFYIPPIFFPNIIWLGLMPVLFGAVFQVAGHGILINSKLHTLYNPGLATALLGHVPIGVCYIYYIQHNGLASGWDWLIAILYMAFAYAIVFRKIIVDGLADENSPYPFDEVELHRFDRFATNLQKVTHGL